MRVVRAEATDEEREPAFEEELIVALTSAIRSSCRVKVDRIEFISAESLEEEAPILVDERTWD